MEITLSQEKSGIKLFIREISLMEIVSALKDELVNVKLYDIGFGNDFTVDSEGKDVTTSVTITEVNTVMGEIIDLVVSLNPLSEMETIDLERLKAGFPQLLEEGLSADEIWERFLRTTLEQEQPYELKLGNDAFYLEAYPRLGYLLTFQSKDKLVSFIEKSKLMLSGQTSEDFMRAVREEKPYATDGFKAVFEEAGKDSFIALFQNFRPNSDKKPGKASSVELAITNRRNYLKLFMEGIHFKDLSKILKNETIYVSELEFIIDDTYNIESHDFKKGEFAYDFNPQKILFGNLINKIEALNLPENITGPFSLNLRTSSFELDSRWSPPVYGITFWRKEAMTDFLDSLKLFVSTEIIDEMKIALMDEKPYCTEGWREDIEKAENECRIDCMIGLLKRGWVTNEEQELVKVLKIITQSQQFQSGIEVADDNDEKLKLTKDDEKIYGRGRPSGRPYLYILVYYRLKEDGMNCFDGDGKIYGFDGEMVINSIIANFSNSKYNVDIKNEMETMLKYYKERFPL